MGFLSLLFGKKTVENSSQAARQSIPTVQLSKEARNFYRESFIKHMSSVTGIASIDVQEMISLIDALEHGYPSMGKMVNQMYEQYFKPYDWSWPLLEEWRDTLIKKRAYMSSRWFPGDDNGDNRTIFDKIVYRLKVDSIRSILRQAGIKVSSKEKKAGLIKILELSVSSEWLEGNSDEWKQAILDVAKSEVEDKIDYKYGEYHMLMHHIRSEAEILHSMHKAAQCGISVCNYMLMGSHDMKSLAREIIKKEPGKIPPLFPDDRTEIRFGLSSFDSNAVGKFPELRLLKDRK